jgi:hypothetical protein
MYTETSPAAAGPHREDGPLGRLRPRPEFEGWGVVAAINCRQPGQATLMGATRVSSGIEDRRMFHQPVFWQIRKQEAMLWSGQYASGIFLPTRS